MDKNWQRLAMLSLSWQYTTTNAQYADHLIYKDPEHQLDLAAACSPAPYTCDVDFCDQNVALAPHSGGAYTTNHLGDLKESRKYQTAWSIICAFFDPADGGPDETLFYTCKDSRCTEQVGYVTKYPRPLRRLEKGHYSFRSCPNIPDAVINPFPFKDNPICTDANCPDTPINVLLAGTCETHAAKAHFEAEGCTHLVVGQNPANDPDAQRAALTVADDYRQNLARVMYNGYPLGTT